MKNKIIDFLQYDRSYESAVSLYHEFGNSKVFKITLNTQCQSKFLKDLLFENLRKLAGIDIGEFNEIVSLPVKKLTIIHKEVEITKLPVVLNVTDIPDEIKKAIRLREDFPFLSREDCPNELKILVADRITAYHNYVDAHASLFEASNLEAIGELSATVVNNYIENQEIWSELNYYKEHGEVLGNHPVFAQTKREAELNALTMGELVAYRDKLKNYIPRTKKEIKTNPDAAENQERQYRVDIWEWEQTVVNRLLKVDKSKK